MTNASIAPEAGCSTISLRWLALPHALAEIAGQGSAEIDLGALPGICDHVPTQHRPRGCGLRGCADGLRRRGYAGHYSLELETHDIAYEERAREAGRAGRYISSLLRR